MNRYIEILEKNSSNWRDSVVRLRGLPFNATNDDLIKFFNGNLVLFKGHGLH